jgi:hypothetical protein
MGMMESAVRKTSVRRALAGAGAGAWLLSHTLLYAVLLLAGSVVTQLVGDSFRSVGDNLLLGLAGAVWFGVLLVPVMLVLLALLRLAKELSWYWFRLVALVLLNLPNLVIRHPGVPWILVILHSVLALLVVQPRWSLEDPV